ncbi:MAG: hypothetical protein JW786_07035 [Desulfobacterales bacterium]|nr:hypothetical protein [Desulfobacterales bacterium]
MDNKIVSFFSVQENLDRMEIMRGRISAIRPNGEIIVEYKENSSSLVCDFLRTSAGSIPLLTKGDPVLFVLEKSGVRGCVIGVVQKYITGEESSYQLDFVAQNKIELRCGGSSLTMSKEGKVILKGSQVVTKASGVNKIKGASVKIN